MNNWAFLLGAGVLLLVGGVTPTYGGDMASITVEAPMGPVLVTPETAITFNPACSASAADYRARYPDVAQFWGDQSDAGIYQHYLLNGIKEGRTWNAQLCAPAGTVQPILAPTTLPNGSPIILGSCGWKPSNGTNCIVFPDGATVGGFTYQSVVKTGNSEVLTALKLSVPGRSERELIRIHHLGISNPAPTFVLLPEPLVLPFQSTIWCYADGWGDPHPAGFECQVTLYLLGTPFWIVQ